MTINELAQKKYIEFIRSAKKGGAIAPGQEESWAKDETRRWLSEYLQSKYNINYNEATN